MMKDIYITLIFLTLFMLPGTTPIKLQGDVEPLLSESGIFEVPGDLYPVTLWIEKEILRETLGQDFRSWICNPMIEKYCFTDNTGIPDVLPLTPDRLEEPKKREKRFIGMLISGLLGIAGIVDAEYSRRMLEGQIEKVASSVSQLATGVHKIGDELLGHMRLDKEWKQDMNGYLHVQFQKQALLNRQLVSDVVNLWHTMNESWNDMEKAIDDTRKRVLSLAKLTSQGLTRLADEVSILNNLIDSMIWTDLKDGKMPEWLISLPRFEEVLVNLSKSLPGYRDDQGNILLKHIMKTVQWTTISITSHGILLGALFPVSSNIGFFSKLTIPPLCVPADDGHFYTMSLIKSSIKVEYKGNTYFRNSDYLESCDKENGLWSCQDPETFPTSRPDVLCSQALFSSDAPDSCMVKLSPCPKKYTTHRTRKTVVVSGEIQVKVGNEAPYLGSNVAFVIPLLLDKSIVFSTHEGVHILTVYPTTSQLVLQPTAISLSGVWMFDPGYPWKGIQKGPSVISLPAFSSPPKYDEGAILVRTSDALEEVDQAAKTASSTIQEIQDNKALFIALSICCVIILIACVILICLCRKLNARPLMPPAYTGHTGTY